MPSVTSLSMKAAASVSYLCAAATPTLRAIPAAGAWWHDLFVEPIRALARHHDPLTEASNWVALLIGSHLPFWPLYIWLSAGAQALPSALLSAAMTPVFLVIPLLSRRSGLGGRVAMLLAGAANTVLTIWITAKFDRLQKPATSCQPFAAPPKRPLWRRPVQLRGTEK